MLVSECPYPRLECAPCPPPQRILDAYSIDLVVYDLLLEAARLGNLTADETEEVRLRCDVTIPTTTTTTITTQQPSTYKQEQTSPDHPHSSAAIQPTQLSTTLPNETEQNTTAVTLPIINSTNTINTSVQDTSTQTFINASLPYSNRASHPDTSPLSTNMTRSSADDYTMFNQTTFSTPSNSSVPIIPNTVARQPPGCRGICLVIVLTTAVCLCLVLLTALAMLFRKRRESSKLERRRRSQQRPVSGIEYDSSFRVNEERSLYNNGSALHFNLSDYSVAYDNPAYRQSTEFRTFGKTRTDPETRIRSAFSQNQSDGNIFYTGAHPYPDMPCESIPKLERRSKSLKPSKTKYKSPSIDYHRRAHSMYDYVPKTLSQFSYQQIDGQDELIYAPSRDRSRPRIKSLESESMNRKKSKKDKSKKQKSSKRSRSYDPMLLEAYYSVPLETDTGNGFIRNETGTRTKADVNITRQNAISRGRCVSDYNGRAHDYVRLTSTSSDYGVETKTDNQSHHSNTDVYYTEPRPRSRDTNRDPTSPSGRSSKRNTHAYNGHTQRTNRCLPRISIDTDLDEVFQRSCGNLRGGGGDRDGGGYDDYYRKWGKSDAPVHFPRHFHDNPDRVYMYHTKL